MRVHKGGLRRGKDPLLCGFFRCGRFFRAHFVARRGQMCYTYRARCNMRKEKTPPVGMTKFTRCGRKKGERNEGRP